MPKSIPKPNKYVDAALMLIFAFELVLLVTTLKDEPRLLAYLAGLIGVVAVAVNVTKMCFRVGGAWFSRRFLQHLGDPLKKQLTMKKWCDQSWQLAIHFSMTVFELYVLRDKQWWQNTKTLWNQNSSTGAFPEYEFSTKLFYLTQLAIWIYTAFSCKFLEAIRKDYVVMMTHHVVTIALVMWSYIVGFLPVGVIVLVLHDLSDVPLDMLKMANYLKLEGARGFFVCEILYVIMLVIWVYLRVYTYPTKLLYTTLFECREASMSPEDARDFSILFPNPGPPSWLMFNLLLGILYCLHIWWTFLIIRLLVGIIKKGAHETSREEYEGTSSDSEDEKNKHD